MESLWLAIASSFWLGILTSISPCPMATNIAAVTFIGKQVGSPVKVFLNGLVYTAGRMISYIGLGIILVGSLLAIPEVALFLQKYMNIALGPALVLVGMLLFGLFRIRIPNLGLSQTLQQKAVKSGIFGAGFLGIVFALSFCPISAALYFGSLIPLAVETNSAVLMPGIYGVGTALPVVIFSIIIAFGARFVGAAFDRLTQLEFWARRITGIIFFIVGTYYILVYIFGVNII